MSVVRTIRWSLNWMNRGGDTCSGVLVSFLSDGFLGVKSGVGHKDWFVYWAFFRICRRLDLLWSYRYGVQVGIDGQGI